MLVKHIAAENRMVVSRGWDEEEMVSCYSMCIKIQLHKIMKFWRSAQHDAYS